MCVYKYLCVHAQNDMLYAHVGIYTYCRRISTNIVLRSDADDVSGIVQLLGSTINS